MESSTTMYTASPHYNFSNNNVVLPDVMYAVAPIITREASNVLPELKQLKLRQERLLQNIEQLLSKIGNKDQSVTTSVLCKQPVQKREDVVQDFVIHVNPNDPPHALKYIVKLLRKKFDVMLKVHRHSSLPNNCIIDESFVNEVSVNRGQKKIIITILWKNVSGGLYVVTSPTMCIPIKGESNALRLFGRLLNIYNKDEDMLVSSTLSDEYMDLCDNLASSTGQEKSSGLQRLEKAVAKQPWLVGNEATIADALVLSTLKKHCQLKQCPHLKNWFDKNYNTVL